jgi:hypothetical protein
MLGSLRFKAGNASLHLPFSTNSMARCTDRAAGGAFWTCCGNPGTAVKTLKQATEAMQWKGCETGTMMDHDKAVSPNVYNFM